MKRPPRSEPAAAEAARLGEELRDARVALGLSLADVAAHLRIRQPYLLALEEGRVGDLPAAAYAVGFVRAYARALGLDDDDMVRRFRAASGPVARQKPDLVFPEAVPERGVPAGAVMLVGAMLAIGGYVGWYQWSGSGARVVDTVPPLPPRLEQAIRQPAPPPAEAAPADPLPDQPAAAPELAPAPVLPPPPAPPIARPPAEQGRVVLRARADAWIQLRDPAARTVLVNRVLRPGESFVVPTRDGLLLSTGNAGGLDIEVDGELVPGLGAAQAVRRDVPLEPERLKAGLPAPAAGTQ